MASWKKQYNENNIVVLQFRDKPTIHQMNEIVDKVREIAFQNNNEVTINRLMRQGKLEEDA